MESTMKKSMLMLSLLMVGGLQAAEYYPILNTPIGVNGTALATTISIGVVEGGPLNAIIIITINSLLAKGKLQHHWYGWGWGSTCSNLDTPTMLDNYVQFRRHGSHVYGYDSGENPNDARDAYTISFKVPLNFCCDKDQIFIGVGPYCPAKSNLINPETYLLLDAIKSNDLEAMKQAILNGADINDAVMASTPAFMNSKGTPLDFAKSINFVAGVTLLKDKEARSSSTTGSN